MKKLSVFLLVLSGLFCASQKPLLAQKVVKKPNIAYFKLKELLVKYGQK